MSVLCVACFFISCNFAFFFVFWCFVGCWWQHDGTKAYCSVARINGAPVASSLASLGAFPITHIWIFDLLHKTNETFKYAEAIFSILNCHIHPFFWGEIKLFLEGYQKVKHTRCLTEKRNSKKDTLLGICSTCDKWLVSVSNRIAIGNWCGPMRHIIYNTQSPNRHWTDRLDVSSSLMTGKNVFYWRAVNCVYMWVYVPVLAACIWLSF